MKIATLLLRKGQADGDKSSVQGYHIFLARLLLIRTEKTSNTVSDVRLGVPSKVTKIYTHQWLGGLVRERGKGMARRRVAMAGKAS